MIENSARDIWTSRDLEHLVDKHCNHGRHRRSFRNLQSPLQQRFEGCSTQTYSVSLQQRSDTVRYVLNRLTPNHLYQSK